MNEQHRDSEDCPCKSCEINARLQMLKTLAAIRKELERINNHLSSMCTSLTRY